MNAHGHGLLSKQLFFLNCKIKHKYVKYVCLYLTMTEQNLGN